MRARLPAVLCLSLLSTACWEYPGPSECLGCTDAGILQLDAGVFDAGADGGVFDAGVDGGVFDAGADGGGVFDAGADAGVFADAGCPPVDRCRTAGGSLPAALPPPGMSVGLCVVPGATVSVNASGSAQYGVDDCGGTLTIISTDPAGVRNGGACAPKFDASAVSASAPVGSLLIQLGTNDWLSAGTSLTATANARGELRFLFNDNLWSDNTGTYRFTVTICP